MWTTSAMHNYFLLLRNVIWIKLGANFFYRSSKKKMVTNVTIGFTWKNNCPGHDLRQLFLHVSTSYRCISQCNNLPILQAIVRSALMRFLPSLQASLPSSLTGDHSVSYEPIFWQSVACRCQTWRGRMKYTSGNVTVYWKHFVRPMPGPSLADIKKRRVLITWLSRGCFTWKITCGRYPRNRRRII